MIHQHINLSQVHSEDHRALHIKSFNWQRRIGEELFPRNGQVSEKTGSPLPEVWEASPFCKDKWKRERRILRKNLEAVYMSNIQQLIDLLMSHVNLCSPKWVCQVNNRSTCTLRWKAEFKKTKTSLCFPSLSSPAPFYLFLPHLHHHHHHHLT